MARELTEEEKQKARDIIAEEEAKRKTATPGKFSEDLLKRMESAHSMPDKSPAKKRGE